MIERRDAAAALDRDTRRKWTTERAGHPRGVGKVREETRQEIRVVINYYQYLFQISLQLRCICLV